MSLIVVPEALATLRIGLDGDAGRRWVADLPAVVEKLCQ